MYFFITDYIIIFLIILFVFFLYSFQAVDSHLIK